MRFIPSIYLKSGMIIAKDLYGCNNELLLSRGQVLSDIEIKRVTKLEIQGIYISKDNSNNVEVKDLVSTKLRNDTVKAVRDVFVQLESTRTTSVANMTNLKDVVKEIIENITSNKDAIINMVDLKAFSDNTYFHSFNVAVFSLVMGVSLGLDKENLYQLGLGALLHDIGKVFIPINILEKKDKLNFKEFNLIKEHPLKGSDYIKYRWDIPIESNIAVLNHHEKYDGTGYPYKLKGEKISLFGKIIAVADVFDALTSNRPYRVAFSPSEAIEYIMGGSGTHFDPAVVNIFSKTIVPYPVGTTVRLSNNLVGIVEENNLCCCMRPKVKILKKDSDSADEYYDLLNDKSLLSITIIGIADI